MCLLIVNPTKGELIPLEYFINADDNNPDGIGIAYSNNKRLIIKKFLVEKAEDVWKYYKKVKENTKSNIVIHFRFSTGGLIDENNIHPIPINRKLCVSHNGVFTHIKPSKTNSDTKNFSIFLSKIKNIETLIYDKSFHSPLNQYLKEKLVFLDNNGKYLILSSDKFHTLNGNFYSNYGYENFNYGWKQNSCSHIWPNDHSVNLNSRHFKDVDGYQKWKNQREKNDKSYQNVKSLTKDVNYTSDNLYSEFCHMCGNYFKAENMTGEYLCKECDERQIHFNHRLL